MQRSWLKSAAAVCVAAALFGRRDRAGRRSVPFVGNWKLTDVTNGNEMTYVLFQVEEKDGKLAGESAGRAAVAARASDDRKLQGRRQVDAVRHQVHGGTLVVKAYARKADAKNKAVLGSIVVNNHSSCSRSSPRPTTRN